MERSGIFVLLPVVVSRGGQMKHTDDDYINYDPFVGDEADIKCRTVTVKKARKEHVCWGLDGNMDHKIAPGEKYRHERALIDGDFWGEFKLCLNCMDKFIAGDY
jgi:hypothetical protein